MKRELFVLNHTMVRRDKTEYYWVVNFFLFFFLLSELRVKQLKAISRDLFGIKYFIKRLREQLVKILRRDCDLFIEEYKRIRLFHKNSIYFQIIYAVILHFLLPLTQTYKRYKFQFFSNQTIILHSHSTVSFSEKCIFSFL